MLGVIGQIALVLFMLLVGLELDHRMLKGRGRSIATVAVGTLALALLLGFVVGPLLYDASFVAAFGTPATAVLSVFMLLAVAAAAGVARDEGAAAIGGRFAVAGVFVIVLIAVVRPALAPLGRAVEALGSLSSTAFTTVFILLFATATAYAPGRIGINVIPGAFLVGVVPPAREIMFREMTAKLRDLTVSVLLP